MKITNEVRTYVEKKVKAQFKAESDALTDALNAESAKLENAKEMAKQAAIEVLEKVYGEKIDEGSVYLSLNSQGYPYRGWAPAYKQELFDKQGALNRKISEIVEEILVDLSLGGTKADIERLISENCGEVA